MPDERFGEVVCAWIRLKDEYEGRCTEHEIREFCAGKVRYEHDWRLSGNDFSKSIVDMNCGTGATECYRELRFYFAFEENRIRFTRCTSYELLVN